MDWVTMADAHDDNTRYAVAAPLIVMLTRFVVKSLATLFIVGGVCTKELTVTSRVSNQENQIRRTMSPGRRPSIELKTSVLALY